MWLKSTGYWWRLYIFCNVCLFFVFPIPIISHFQSTSVPRARICFDYSRQIIMYDDIKSSTRAIPFLTYLNNFPASETKRTACVFTWPLRVLHSDTGFPKLVLLSSASEAMWQNSTRTVGRASFSDGRPWPHLRLSLALRELFTLAVRRSRNEGVSSVRWRDGWGMDLIQFYREDSIIDSSNCLMIPV